MDLLLLMLLHFLENKTTGKLITLTDQRQQRVYLTFLVSFKVRFNDSKWIFLLHSRAGHNKRLNDLHKSVYGRGLEFDMRCHILHVFKTSTAIKEKSSDHFKALDKLKLLTNSDVNTTSFLGGVPNYVLSV